MPGQPLNLTAEAKSSRSILVTWKNPVFHGNGLDGNEVQYKSQIGSFKKASEFGLTSNLLQNLNPFTNYTINVLAKSFGGLGPPSEPIYCMTMEDSEYISQTVFCCCCCDCVTNCINLFLAVAISALNKI